VPDYQKKSPVRAKVLHPPIENALAPYNYDLEHALCRRKRRSRRVKRKQKTLKKQGKGPQGVQRGERSQKTQEGVASSGKLGCGSLKAKKRSFAPEDGKRTSLFFQGGKEGVWLQETKNVLIRSGRGKFRTRMRKTPKYDRFCQGGKGVKTGLSGGDFNGWGAWSWKEKQQRGPAMLVKGGSEGPREGHGLVKIPCGTTWNEEGSIQKEKKRKGTEKNPEDKARGGAIVLLRKGPLERERDTKHPHPPA